MNDYKGTSNPYAREPSDMAELKTKPTEADVRAFIDAVPDETRRRDGHTICDLFEKVTGEKPVMWGPSIIGFGKCQLKYASGRELEWMVCGFSPRKANHSLYLDCNIANYAESLKSLGKYKTGKGCLYVNKLADIDIAVLKKMIESTWANRNKAKTVKGEEV